MENFKFFLDLAIKNNTIDLNQALNLIKLAEEQYPRHDLISKNLVGTGNPIEDIMTLKEAEELWLKDRTTLTKNITAGKYLPGDVRKSKGTWLITTYAMKRLYGDMVNKENKER